MTVHSNNFTLVEMTSDGVKRAWVSPEDNSDIAPEWKFFSEDESAVNGDVAFQVTTDFAGTRQADYWMNDAQLRLQFYLGSD